MFNVIQKNNNFTSIIIPYNSSTHLTYINYSKTSDTEINEGRDIKEIETFNRQYDESIEYQDFFKYYENRIISFKGDIDWSGKIELMEYSNKNITS